jgi:hypothetical protein
LHLANPVIVNIIQSSLLAVHADGDDSSEYQEKHRSSYRSTSSFMAMGKFDNRSFMMTPQW